MTAERETTGSDLDVLIDVAERYYLKSQTQSQIARQMGISVSSVSRLLSRALREGIVRITIVRPHGRQPGLEHSLCQTYHLSEAIVAQVPREAYRTDAWRERFATVAAPAIDARIKIGQTVGIGRGRLMAALGTALHAYATPRHMTCVQVMGEDVSQHSPNRSAELARVMAEMYGGLSYYLNAPALVDDPALAAMLQRSSGINQLQAFYERLDMMLVGVGPLRGSALDANGLLREEHIRQLEGAGALGDICGHFFASDGRFVDAAYPGRAIGMSIAQIRRCPQVVLVAAGDEKVPAMCALLKTGMVHVLATDERTALQLVPSPRVTP